MTKTRVHFEKCITYTHRLSKCHHYAYLENIDRQKLS